MITLFSQIAWMPYDKWIIESRIPIPERLKYGHLDFKSGSEDA
jgi:hypothetical protein